MRSRRCSDLDHLPTDVKAFQQRYYRLFYCNDQRIPLRRDHGSYSQISRYFLLTRLRIPIDSWCRCILCNELCRAQPDGAICFSGHAHTCNRKCHGCWHLAHLHISSHVQRPFLPKESIKIDLTKIVRSIFILTK